MHMSNLLCLYYSPLKQVNQPACCGAKGIPVLKMLAVHLQPTNHHNKFRWKENHNRHWR